MNENLFLFRSQRLANPWHFHILKSTFSYIDEYNISENVFHWHDYFEIEIITSGSLTHKLNNKVYQYNRGDVCLLNYTDFHTHSLNDKNEKVTAYNINFDEYAVSEEILNVILNHSQPLICHFEDDELDALVYDINQLQTECNSQDDLLKLPFLSAGFLKVVTLILRKCKIEQFDDDIDLTYTPFCKCVTYIKSHFRENISLKETAKIVGLTPNYLGLLIKKNTGKNFMEYITNMRLVHAENLLKHSCFSIDYISQASGFPSCSYFIKTFKKHHNITPKQYQKQYQNID